MIGLPLLTCSSPSSAMISVPDACLLPRRPGKPQRAMSASVELLREGRNAAREIAPVECHRRAGDFPMAGRRILAVGALDGIAPLAADRQVREAFAAAFRSPVPPPRRGPARRDGEASSRTCSAIWPIVLAPSSPKCAASGAPPMPTESSMTRKARLIWSSPGSCRGRADAVPAAPPMR